MTFLAAMSEAGVSVMEKCRGSEVASAAETSTIALSATQPAASISAPRHEDAVENSSLGGSQPSNPLPGVEELDQHMALAESLRAQFIAAVARYVADAVSKGLNSMHLSLSVLRQLG